MGEGWFVSYQGQAGVGSEAADVAVGVVVGVVVGVNGVSWHTGVIHF